MKKIVKLLIKFLEKILYLIGYSLNLEIKKLNKNHLKENKLNLNIGSGQYTIRDFKSLDIYSKHYYPNKNKFLKERIEYNLRKDKIPFEDNTVDNIYNSHVIEHVEDEFVNEFIKEAYRVLKPGGVLRIVCPDAKFMFDVSQFSNEYWKWRKEGTFSDKKKTNTDWNIIEQYDYLIKELSSAHCRFYNYKIDSNIPDINELKKLSYEKLKNFLKQKTKFRDNYPNDHINLHDFESLSKTAYDEGFSYVLNSKKGGSVSAEMQNFEFDRTSPQNSLYLDMIK